MKLGLALRALGVAAVAALLLLPTAPAGPSTTAEAAAPALTTVSARTYNGEPLVKSDADWKKSLTPDQYDVCRLKGTERPFTGKYWDNHETGLYRCSACGLELFTSNTKFDSGTGWPSFFQPIAANVVKVIVDKTHGMVREEVTCARCGSHLGHVFNDGPKPTGLRYCMNSVSLDFVKATDAKAPADKPAK